MIWIDEREGSRDLADPLRRAGVEVEMRRLEYGDACWMGEGPDGPCLIGVEVKTTTDLLNSMRTGRLCGHQLPGMTEQYSVLYLITVGIVRSDPQSGVLQHNTRGQWRDVLVGQQRFMWRDYDHYLTSIDTLMGVRVRRVGTVKDAVDTLVSLYNWWQKPWEGHGSHKVIYTPDPKTVFLVRPSTLRKVAVQLPGIGWERSRDVERHFRTVRRMAEAGVEEWRSIPGIGKITAGKVVRVINEGD